MKSPTRFLAAPLLCLLAASAAHAQANAISWISSTQSAPWRKLTVEPSAATSGNPIVVNGSTTFQTIDGFGGCFNDLGWRALEDLTPSARESALASLFAPDGANFTLGRLPMGANDFATQWYSYDETPGDYALKDFSIEHDRQTLIPFLHAAMKYQPKLAVWAVPWSPPAWLKTNGAYKGGAMKDDPESLAAYAIYFSKYIQAYRAEGINLYAVMPQNEPRYNNNVYPQAAWSGQLMDIFLRDYLAPRLKQDNVNVEIWQGTLVNANLDAYVTPVLGDPRTNPLVTGVAYQYDGQQAMLETHKLFPGKKLMQSETECYNGDNLWQHGLATFAKIIEDTNHFAGSYFFWNIVLDDTETSTWGWRQNSLITIDRSAKTVHYNPEFYSMKHFSAGVMPGAVRIAVAGGPFAEIAAFRNPDRSEVLEFENSGDSPVRATLQLAGKSYALDIPAKSMNTVTVPAHS